jgi:hypothetical protein
VCGKKGGFMKLEECIGRRDLNAAKLSRLIGYNKTYVQQILAGSKEPGVKFLKALENIRVEEIKKYPLFKHKMLHESSFNDS